MFWLRHKLRRILVPDGPPALSIQQSISFSNSDFAAMATAIKNAMHNIEQKVLGRSTVPPKVPSDDQVKQLRQKYEKAGQEQVFTFYDSLDSADKVQLYEQLSDFDPNHINELA